MSRWNQLGPGWATVLDDTELADEPGVELLIALGREARIRAAAEQLAREEFELGAYVDESEPLPSSVRLAAEDHPSRSTTVVYRDGPLQISAHLDDSSALVLVQLAGPPGITVILGDEWVALQPGFAVRVEHVSAVPPTLEILDRKGRRRTLPPDPTPGRTP